MGEWQRWYELPVIHRNLPENRLTDPSDDDGCTGGAIGTAPTELPSEPLAVMPVEASSDVMEAV